MTPVNPDNNDLLQEYKDLASLLSTIVDTLPMYLFVKDTGDNFRYVYSSSLMNQIYKHNEDGVIGKTDFELFSSSVIAQTFRDKDLEILKNGVKQRFVEQMVDPQGMLRSIDTTKLLVPRENKSPYLLGMAWDITSQRQIDEEQNGNNKRLAMACQAGHIYPWIWDMKTGQAEITMVKDGNIHYDPLMHEEFTKKIHPADQQLYRDMIDAFVYRKVDSLHFSFRCCYFTDDYIWLEKIGEVYEYDPEGKPLKSIGVLRDMTADKRQEEDRRAKVLAEESDRMKSAFIANMSHEIRTPLNAIVGFSTLMAQADSEDEKREYLKVIESSNDFLLQLIGDILDISKIESGKLEFVYSTFRLNDIFRLQQQAFKLRAYSGVEVIFENDGNDYCIVSEKTRLTQVITNFLSNAIKFTSSGSIRFGYRVTEKGIYCYVSDTGTGIREEKVEAVFERFVKLDNFKQGTGLGLSICKTIISMLKGEIGVDSKLGEGSTFWFSIPCNPMRVG